MKAIVALVIISAACAYGTPVDFEEIAPMFNAERDVRFLLQTRQNRAPVQIQFRNLASITNTHFNRARQTRFLVHGWFEDDTSDINTATANELLDYNDFNIIIVDWSEGSRTINYIGAANRVPHVGLLVAQQIVFMAQNGLLAYNQLTVVGFSLGAHIAGTVGKRVTSLAGARIDKIFGLDPAGPLFSVRNPAERIDSTDANYVEIIHTNGPTLWLVGAGIGAPIGHADYWPNGGTSQPGCLTNTCSHGLAVTFYVESIQHNRFFAHACPDHSDNVSSRRCNISPGQWMGGDRINFVKNSRGSFYLETNRNRPHAQGPQR